MTNTLRALLSPFRYTVDDNGRITIIRLLDKLSTVSLIVPEGVSAIAPYAFEGASSLVRVYLPESLEEIGAFAFSLCRKLRRVHLGSLESYLSVRFANRESCPGAYAREFYVNGEPITSYTLPKGQTAIQAYAFSGMSTLEKVTLTEGLTAIGDHAFSDCGLTSLTLPKSLRSLGTYAFWNNPLGYVKIGEGLTSLSVGAFGSCTLLSKIDLPDSLTLIDDAALAYTALTECRLPKNVTEIAQGAFRDCKDMTTLICPESLRVIGHYAFYNDTALKTVVFSSGIQVIGDYTFAHCTALQALRLPNGLALLGQGTFFGCTALKELHFPLKKLSIGQSTIFGCTALCEVTAPRFVYLNGKTLPVTPYHTDMGKSTLFPEEIARLSVMPLSKQTESFFLTSVKEEKLTGGAVKQSQMKKSLADALAELVVKDGVIVGVICYETPIFPEKSIGYDHTPETSGYVAHEKLTLHYTGRNNA